MNIEEFDNDTSDEDFVPEVEKTEAFSDDESDEDVEQYGEEEEDGNRKRSKKRGRSKKGKNKKICVEEEPEEVVEPIKEEDQKKRADNLWADFLKDTDTKPKPKTELTVPEKTEQLVPKLKEKVEKKIMVTKIFEFAGEEVKVTKEVPVDSLEARISAPTTTTAPSRGRTRGGLGGISSVLSHLGKKQKISTLEKTKLDWDQFKKDEKIEDELTSHNKGKHGYLERQDFLQRADLRQFEIEKEIRATRRSSRL